MNLTVKQEAFAQAYIENGGNATEAYRRAYNAKKMAPTSIHVNACKLLKKTNVALRIDELRKEHAERHAVTVDLLTEKLWKAEQLAYQVENPSAAVSAVMGAAKLHGLVIDKVKGDPSAPVYINKIQMVVVDPYEETEH